MNNIIYFERVNQFGNISNYANFNNVEFFGHSTGYYKALANDKYPVGSRLHRIIYEQYYGSILEGYEIHHKDFNKSNNDITNLECLTISEHRKLHGNNQSQETKNKISDSGKNRKFSKEHKQKLSNSHIGIKHSNETKKRLSEVNTINFSLDEQLKIIDLFKSGFSQIKIAKQYNVSRTPIYRILKQYNLI